MNNVQKAATGGSLGLSAAAIIFLFTNFVSKSEFDKLEKRYEKTQELVVILKARSDQQYLTTLSQFE